MERTKNRRFRFAAVLFLTAALLLVAACAAAEEHHTFVLKCTGGGFVGRPASGTRSEITAVPETEIETEAKDGRWKRSAPCRTSAWKGRPCALQPPACRGPTSGTR